MADSGANPHDAAQAEGGNNAGGQDGGLGGNISSDGGGLDAGDDSSVPFVAGPALEIGPTVTLATALPDVAAITLSVPNEAPSCSSSGGFACNGGCLDSTTVGAVTGSCKLLATGAQEITGFQYDGMSLFYSTATPQQVRRLSVADSMDALLTGDDAQRFLVGLHNSDVLVTEYTSAGAPIELYATPKAGGALTRLLADTPVDYKFQYVGDYAYYMIDGGDLAAMHRAQLDTGVDENLFGAEAEIQSFVTDGTWAFAGLGAFNPTIVVTKLDRSEPAIQIAQGFRPSFGNIIFEGSYVYWQRSSDADLMSETSSFERMALGTTTVEAIATLPALFGTTKISGDTVYFRDTDETAATEIIYRMPLSGGDLEQVATFTWGPNITDFFVGDGVLYVALSLGGDGVIVEITLP